MKLHACYYLQKSSWDLVFMRSYQLLYLFIDKVRAKFSLVDSLVRKIYKHLSRLAIDSASNSVETEHCKVIKKNIFLKRKIK
jgi:hypothetical protein